MRSAKNLAVLFAALTAIVAPLQSRADTPSFNVVSPPGAYASSNVGNGTAVVSNGFAPAALVVTQTGQLTYTNLDIQGHNFVSAATTTDPATWDPRYCDILKPPTWQPGDALPPCPLFQDWSVDTDATGTRYITQSAPVLLQMPDGTPKLQPNTPYIFYCSYHPGMKATLVALPA